MRQAAHECDEDGAGEEQSADALVDGKTEEGEGEGEEKKFG